MKTALRYSALAALLAMSFGARADVEEKAHEVKEATVETARKVGDTVSEATSAAIAGGKHIAVKVADTAVRGYEGAKKVSKEAVATAASKTREVAGKVEEKMRK